MAETMEMTELLKILVCPACKGQLKPAHDGRDEGFACEACQVVYPIRDEIPIMLVNEAIPMDAWQKGKR